MPVLDKPQNNECSSDKVDTLDRERLVALAKPTFEEALGIASRSGMSVQNARRAAAAATARYVTLRTGMEISYEWIERHLR